MELAVIEHSAQGITVIKLRGELDIASSPDVREQLLTALNTRKPSSLILDLSELEFMDSSGTAVLVSAEKHAQSLGCEFALIAPRRPVARVLHICGLDHYLRIFENFAAVPEAQGDHLSIADHSVAWRRAALPWPATAGDSLPGLLGESQAPRWAHHEERARHPAAVWKRSSPDSHLTQAGAAWPAVASPARSAQQDTKG